MNREAGQCIPLLHHQVVLSVHHQLLSPLHALDGGEREALLPGGHGDGLGVPTGHLQGETGGLLRHTDVRACRGLGEMF